MSLSGGLRHISLIFYSVTRDAIINCKQVPSGAVLSPLVEDRVLIRIPVAVLFKLWQRRRSDLKSGGTKKFRLAPSALAKFFHIYSYTWAPTEKFPEGRKTTYTFKNIPLFGRAEDINDNLRVFYDV